MRKIHHLPRLRATAAIATCMVAGRLLLASVPAIAPPSPAPTARSSASKGPENTGGSVVGPGNPAGAVPDVRDMAAPLGSHFG